MGHLGKIDEIFDTISYSKVALVIRMLYDYVGENVCFNKKSFWLLVPIPTYSLCPFLAFNPKE